MGKHKEQTMSAKKNVGDKLSLAGAIGDAVNLFGFGERANRVDPTLGFD
jgi:hypothetical protein